MITFQVQCKEWAERNGVDTSALQTTGGDLSASIRLHGKMDNLEHGKLYKVTIEPAKPAK